MSAADLAELVKKLNAKYSAAPFESPTGNRAKKASPSITNKNKISQICPKPKYSKAHSLSSSEDIQQDESNELEDVEEPTSPSLCQDMDQSFLESGEPDQTILDEGGPKQVKQEVEDPFETDLNTPNPGRVEDDLYSCFDENLQNKLKKLDKLRNVDSGESEGHSKRNSDEENDEEDEESEFPEANVKCEMLEDEGEEEDVQIPISPPEPVRKKRGRPRKKPISDPKEDSEYEDAVVLEESDFEDTQPKKRKRKPSRKALLQPKEEPDDPDFDPDEEEHMKDKDYKVKGGRRGRGRPRKGSESNYESGIKRVKDSSERGKGKRGRKPAGSLTCEVCQEVFKKRYYYSMHRFKEHGISEVMCSKCGLECPNQWVLNKHLHSHVEGKNYTCEHCAQNFKYNNSLKRHIRIVHLGEMKSICSDCGKCFTQPSGLYVHQRLVHNHLKKDGTAGYKREHIPSTCEVCGKQYFSQFYLKYVHMKVHNKERAEEEGTRSPMKNNTCSVCDKVFVKRETLRFHVKTVHEGYTPYPCSIEGCTESYKDKRTLYNHIRKVHPDEANQIPEAASKYTCDFCGKQNFYNKAGFELHRSTHTKEKQVVCPICRKVFNSKTYIKTHMEGVHGYGGKVLICDFPNCAKRFSTRKYLLDHVKKHKRSKEGSIRPYTRTKKSIQGIHNDLELSGKSPRPQKPQPDLSHHSIPQDGSSQPIYTFPHQYQNNPSGNLSNYSAQAPYQFQGVSHQFGQPSAFYGSPSDSYQESCHESYNVESPPQLLPPQNPSPSKVGTEPKGVGISPKSKLRKSPVRLEEFSTVKATKEALALKLAKQNAKEEKKKKEKMVKSNKRKVEKEGSVTCHICGQVFSSETYFKYYHLRKHTDQKYKCIPCNKEFARAQTLKHHQVTVHDGIIPYVCPEEGCQNEFKDRRSFKAHLRKVHPNKADDILNSFLDSGREKGRSNATKDVKKKKSDGIIQNVPLVKDLRGPIGRKQISNYIQRYQIQEGYNNMGSFEGNSPPPPASSTTTVYFRGNLPILSQGQVQTYLLGGQGQEMGNVPQFYN